MLNYCAAYITKALSCTLYSEKYRTFLNILLRPFIIRTSIRLYTLVYALNVDTDIALHLLLHIILLYCIILHGNYYLCM